MPAITVHVASAFSQQGAGGNKAGVVLFQHGLQPKEKVTIARILGYSETAFVTGSEKADFKLEYFTPVQEVPLCGHATIGAFVVLRDLGLLSKNRYTIEVQSGELNVNVEEDGLIWMDQNKPQFGARLESSLLSGCFDIRHLDERFPVHIMSTGLRDIVAGMDTPGHLRELDVNFERIAALCQRMDVVGLHVFSLVEDGEIRAQCRNFAPLYGIDEESATGTSNAALACYLFERGYRQDRYVFEQGHVLNAVSRILVHIRHERDAIQTVAVGGYGYVAEKKIIHPR